jgi:S-adenosylmethionine:tRNA ribosyltransferase-isomerase
MYGKLHFMITPQDFNYQLPPEKIAQVPTHPRDAAKLMVIDRQSQKISHTIFNQLPNYLTNNDVLVLNDSKVFPARLIGQKQSGGHTEVLLLRPTGNDTWEAMSRGLKPPQIVRFSDSLIGIVVDKNHDSGTIIIRLESRDMGLEQALDRWGQTPIPPYIQTPLTESTLRQEYQTVYANEKGSAAAPTAGLHFTESLLSDLQKQGVQIERVTLHVGPGTFAKLRPEQIESKSLHHEWYSISPDTADHINQAKCQGKRIIAVGTTACRVLESAASPLLREMSEGQRVIQPGSRTTDLFIMPPHQFHITDALITNFHLPESSLLMLVTAFCADNPHFSESIMGRAYQTAIEQDYRFFSFGDAMLIQ